MMNYEEEIEKSGIDKAIDELRELPITPMTRREIMNELNVSSSEHTVKKALGLLVRRRDLYKLTFNASKRGGSHKYRAIDLYNKNHNKTYYARSPVILTKLFFDSINMDGDMGKIRALNHLVKDKILPLWRM